MGSYDIVNKYPDRWVENIDGTYSYQVHRLTVKGELYEVITRDTITAAEYFKQKLTGTL